jgi:hypothetical protein
VPSHQGATWSGRPEVSPTPRPPAQFYRRFRPAQCREVAA